MSTFPKLDLKSDQDLKGFLAERRAQLKQHYVENPKLKQNKRNDAFIQAFQKSGKLNSIPSFIIRALNDRYVQREKWELLKIGKSKIKEFIDIWEQSGLGEELAVQTLSKFYLNPESIYKFIDPNYFILDQKEIDKRLAKDISHKSISNFCDSQKISFSRIDQSIKEKNTSKLNQDEKKFLTELLSVDYSSASAWIGLKSGEKQNTAFLNSLSIPYGEITAIDPNKPVIHKYGYKLFGKIDQFKIIKGEDKNGVDPTICVMTFLIDEFSGLARINKILTYSIGSNIGGQDIIINIKPQDKEHIFDYRDGDNFTQFSNPLVVVSALERDSSLSDHTKGVITTALHAANIFLSNIECVPIAGISIIIGIVNLLIKLLVGRDADDEFEPVRYPAIENFASLTANTKYSKWYDLLEKNQGKNHWQLKIAYEVSKVYDHVTPSITHHHPTQLTDKPDYRHRFEEFDPKNLVISEKCGYFFIERKEVEYVFQGRRLVSKPTDYYSPSRYRTTFTTVKNKGEIENYLFGPFRSKDKADECIVFLKNNNVNRKCLMTARYFYRVDGDGSLDWENFSCDSPFYLCSDLKIINKRLPIDFYNEKKLFEFNPITFKIHYDANDDGTYKGEDGSEITCIQYRMELDQGPYVLSAEEGGLRSIACIHVDPGIFFAHYDDPKLRVENFWSLINDLKFNQYDFNSMQFWTK